jgi:hypothetical protein
MSPRYTSRLNGQFLFDPFDRHRSVGTCQVVTLRYSLRNQTPVARSGVVRRLKNSWNCWLIGMAGRTIYVVHVLLVAGLAVRH